MTLDDKNSEINEVLESRFAQLNSVIAAHEKRLKKMMVPRNTRYKYRSYQCEFDGSQPLAEVCYYIGMIKLRGEWRLSHAEHYVSYCHQEEEVEWKPLVDATIDERINAADFIDKLREAIVDSKEKLIPELETTIAALVESLE